MDRVFLQGMAFSAGHGTRPEERALGTRFLVDLEVEADLRRPGASDSLEDTVNYSRLYRAVQEVMEGPPKNLLEALAEAIAQKVLAGFPVQAVRVRVRKAPPPLRGAILESAGVEVYRHRPEGPPPDEI